MPPGFDDEDLSISLSSSVYRRSRVTASDGDSQQPRNRQHPDGANNVDKKLGEHQPQSTRTNQRLGQYKIIKTLGEGSFGKVKLAVHEVSGQKVALKIISRRKVASRDMVGRVEREIQYLQLLRHPHIIKLYTVITTPTEIIMVLEYAGGELFDYIVSKGKMREDEARRFFQQIICAVEYCHRHKIVHRDLKPENLLLDEDLNVKIADFGLSNIMTDGNFLKTSCGSPNYAAPEVINGKLYAGPEVDVWSCGVILYVLLVGRLPFDDDHIPSLFRKIAQGRFMVPSYLSSEALNLIRRMLATNPVHRITVQEIRQDSWFNKNLPQYLQLPPEEFFDTGVDPNKAINPRAIAPGKPPAVQEKIHDAVIGKLGKTMGYNKHDVQEALTKDEPSAIKDAYLIVRENQLMKANPELSNEKGAFPFLAQSPPGWHSNMPSSPQQAAETRPDPARVLPPLNQEAATSSNPEAHVLPSNVSILPSSLPEYHRAYMLGNPSSAALPTDTDTGEEPRVRTEAEQAATARALKPSMRNSQVALDKAANKPEGMTPLPQKKAKPTRWQFGIRSRNAPHEAMLCIYKALKRLGAEWEVDDDSGADYEDEDFGGNDIGYGVNQSDRPKYIESGDLSIDGGPLHHESSMDTPLDSTNIRRREEKRRRTKERNPDAGYIPKDPWCIKARWRKDGMYPPGTVHPNSAHSSTINLQDHNDKISRKRSSTVGSMTTPGQEAATTMTATEIPRADDSCYVYMEIQLYVLEPDTYLVDFKCDGYETVYKINDGERSHFAGIGRHIEEKDVSSPFPFLDLAGKLIIALAEAD